MIVEGRKRRKEAKRGKPPPPLIKININKYKNMLDTSPPESDSMSLRREALDKPRSRPDERKGDHSKNLTLRVKTSRRNILKDTSAYPLWGNFGVIWVGIPSRKFLPKIRSDLVLPLSHT